MIEMNASIHMRRYRPEDLEETVAVWRASRDSDPYVASLHRHYTLQQETAFFRDMVAAQHDVWLAETGGRIVALLAIKDDYVDRFYVAADLQRQGIGAALLEKARGLSPSRLRLHTHVQNTRARAFYEKHGFKAIRFGVSPPPESEPDVEYCWQQEPVMTPPQYPSGPFEPEEHYSRQRRDEFIAAINGAPAALRQAVSGLSEQQLDTRYKNWTIRQIVHHVSDSHVHSYIRFKWTLTEDRPTIKAYDEGRWAALDDARAGDVRSPLALLDGLHACWVDLLRGMSDEQFARAFVHPETGLTVTLSAALPYYAWHGRHHTGQIAWLRNQNGW